MKSIMETLCGDNMILNDLIIQLNLDIALSPLANQIEISDSFNDNPLLESDNSQIRIYSNEDNATRVICLDLDKKLIVDLFKLENRTGGTVYTFDGLITQTI